MTAEALRALYRQVGEAGFAQVRAAHERAELDAPLDHILQSAWIEGRELVGWRYDSGAQCWRRADGTAVSDDDGREWA